MKINKNKRKMQNTQATQTLKDNGW